MFTSSGVHRPGKDDLGSIYVVQQVYVRHSLRIKAIAPAPIPDNHTNEQKTGMVWGTFEVHQHQHVNR